MGTDIHMYVEIWKDAVPTKIGIERVGPVEGISTCHTESGKDAKWHKVGDVFYNSSYKWYQEHQSERMPEWLKEKTDQPYTDRNYDLFAFLSDVRNGNGFGMCDTGNRIEPLVGEGNHELPDDLSEELQEIRDEFGNDGHSDTCLTLQQLRDADWNTPKIHRYYVDIENYKTFVKDGAPRESCGDIMGPDVLKVSNEEMDAYCEYPQSIPIDKKLFTQIEWEESIRDCVGSHFFKMLDLLETMVDDPNHIRIICWYDN